MQSNRYNMPEASSKPARKTNNTWATILSRQINAVGSNLLPYGPLIEQVCPVIKRPAASEELPRDTTNGTAKNKISSDTGNRTPSSTVRASDVDHYTISD